MEIAEIEETSENKNTDESNPNPNPNPNPKPKSRSVTTSVPEVEIHLFRRGKGPIAIFNSTLGGWDQDQLEVRDICDKYGLKSIYAFNTGSVRGAPIRFHQKTGRSVLPYRDGSVILVDGEPKDSLIQPVTKILLGVALMTLMITFVMKEKPQWVLKLHSLGGTFPPWILACTVIVFTRMRKRTGDIMRKFGW